jgi:thiosulfate dehydrogenase (quinone) large subunit
MMQQQNYTNAQAFFIVTLRILIGWHFLYEGIVKLVNPNWSSIGFLLDSKGFLAGFFQSLTENPSVLNVVDFLNIWGLILIGISLMFGIFTRLGVAAGAVLLAFYYVSHPPFPSLTYAAPSEGNYLIVNKTLIEMAALLVLFVFPSGKIAGLDRLIHKLK